MCVTEFLNCSFTLTIENNAPLISIINAALPSPCAPVRLRILACSESAFSFTPIARDDDVTVVRTGGSIRSFILTNSLRGTESHHVRLPAEFPRVPTISTRFRPLPDSSAFVPLFLLLQFLLLVFLLLWCRPGGNTRRRLVKPWTSLASTSTTEESPPSRKCIHKKLRLTYHVVADNSNTRFTAATFSVFLSKITKCTCNF